MEKLPTDEVRNYPKRVLATNIKGTTVKTTLSIIKADVGSIGGHVAPQ